MTDEFKKARDEAAANSGLDIYNVLENWPLLPPAWVAEAKKTGYQEGAEWAYEWCQVEALTKEAEALAEALEKVIIGSHKDNAVGALERWRKFRGENE